MKRIFLKILLILIVLLLIIFENKIFNSSLKRDIKAKKQKYANYNITTYEFDNIKNWSELKTAIENNNEQFIEIKLSTEESNSWIVDSTIEVSERKNCYNNI